jgi:hypothetical protein
MKPSYSLIKVRDPRKRQSGQVMVFVLLGLGAFLIGAMALAIDLSNLWFHRQSVQSAADAACTAGAMDLLRDQTNSISSAPYPGNFTPGANFDCSATTPNTATTNPSPCVYAALNGYASTISQASATSGTLGNNVSVIFNGAPPPGVAGANVMEVDVRDNLPTFFAGMLQGKRTQSVRAVAKCGIQQVAAPIPLIVLDPVNPFSTGGSPPSAFDISGSPLVRIYGGPQQSIQVNSGNNAAVQVSGSALVDLSQGGPATPPTGSNFGAQGGPIQPPPCNPGTKGFCAGTTGTWMSPSSAILDPLQALAAPTATTPTYPGANTGSFGNTGSNGTGTPFATVPGGTDGCSSNGGTCVVFKPGKYSNGICLGTGGCNAIPGGTPRARAAVFEEGLYYLTGDLNLESNSCVRMATTNPGGATYSGWGGVMFYFSGTAKLNINSNAGNASSGCGPTVFTVGSGGPTGQGVFCDSTALGNIPANLTASTHLTGNVLLAPCTGTYGDQNYSATFGRQRGILFFQDRTAKSVSSSSGGGGSYAMAGTFYFHSCSGNTGGAPPCVTPSTDPAPANSYFSDTLVMQGSPGTQSYILGEIIVDNLQLGGSPSIYMDLNPSSVNNVYKAALYQ